MTLHHQLGWRFCKGGEICEGMVAVLTLPERPPGPEICRQIINEFSSHQIDILQVLSITTDGAPA